MPLVARREDALKSYTPSECQIGLNIGLRLAATRILDLQCIHVHEVGWSWRNIIDVMRVRFRVRKGVGARCARIALLWNPEDAAHLVVRYHRVAQDYSLIGQRPDHCG